MRLPAYHPPPLEAFVALDKSEPLAPSMPTHLMLELAVPAGAFFVGDAKFSPGAAVLICGHFRGTIECGALYVAAGASVKGQIQAIDLHIEGKAEGRVDVKRLLHVGPFAEIRGIHSQGLVRVVSPRASISV